ncbi:MAG: TSUP family transporter [Actinophytocola sp.]|nr:TSUP family transporter [Actinophytocola sp.]
MTVTLLVAGLVLLLGALVQGVVGYGMNLVVAPLLTLIDPSLVPVPLLLIASVHALLAAAREHDHADWKGVGWAMAGRLPGIAIGVAVVALLPQGPFAIAVALAVLSCVGLSLLTWRPSPTPRSLLVAGVASGTFGTAAAIGGPPIALLYQHAAGPTIRATMAVYFAVGTLASVGALALSGQVHGDPVLHAALLLPFLVAGFWLSTPLRRFIDGPWMRPAVLIVAITSAFVLLGRALIG